jgi:hypothetical protein
MADQMACLTADKMDQKWVNYSEYAMVEKIVGAKAETRAVPLVAQMVAM